MGGRESSLQTDNYHLSTRRHPFEYDGTCLLYTSYPVEELMTPEQAAQKALSLIAQGIVKHYYLGIYDEKPVYEVLVSLGDEEHYIIIDAKTGDVLLQFDIK